MARCAVWAMSVLLVSGTASAAGDEAGKASVTDEDRQFLKMAASSNMLEHELGEYAEDNASNEQVKQFGKLMASDHENANDSLKTVAEKSGIELPDEMLPEHKAKLEQLKKLEGAEFDRAYIREMVTAHEQNVKEFRKQANQPRSEVDRWASTTLPTLQSHLDKAKSIQQRIGGRAATEH